MYGEKCQQAPPQRMQVFLRVRAIGMDSGHVHGRVVTGFGFWLRFIYIDSAPPIYTFPSGVLKSKSDALTKPRHGPTPTGAPEGESGAEGLKALGYIHHS